MLLKDLLSKSVIDNLNNIKTNKKDKRSKDKAVNDKSREKKEKSVLHKTRKSNKPKHSTNIKDDLDFTYKYKKHYILECPYCSSKELEVTGNNYYYCEDCGMKVDKIFNY